MEHRRLEAAVHGWVQGVGFRWHTRDLARRLGLQGYVRNRPDRTVEVVAEGPEPALRELSGALQMRLSEIISVASFYNQFRLKPAGRQDGDDQAGRGIIPADIRVRQSETATPEPGIGAGNFKQPPESLQSPPVTVHIGRIEVRAVVAPGSEPERKRPADSPPRLTLAEYLQRREKGSQ